VSAVVNILGLTRMGGRASVACRRSSTCKSSAVTSPAAASRAAAPTGRSPTFKTSAFECGGFVCAVGLGGRWAAAENDWTSGCRIL
jgi:hypothetical protein